MIAAIHQPNYLPWLGFFNKMARSDIFVIFDDVQLPRGKSFETRNRVKTPNGVQWLTVPIAEKGELNLIKDAMIVQDGKWQIKHWKTIQLSYKRAPYFDRYAARFDEIYSIPWEKLCDLNVALIKLIKELLGIKATLVSSSDLKIEARGTDKIFLILRELKADRYLTGEGKGSKRYVFEEDFVKNNIGLIYQDFEHPVYRQLWGDFAPELSVIDLLFNEGDRSLDILTGALS
ncbi:MAG: WbqC family protein [Chloroflexi bacterium]|nr:WbqC family protein [Chloroflexota bacterium]